MCYDRAASIRASVIGFASSVVLYNTGDPLIAQISVFFAFVTLMQVYDLIFWTYPGQNTTNRVFTQIAMITNHLQPIVFAYLINRVIALNLTTVYIYAIVAILYSIKVSNMIRYTGTTEREGLLLWEWNTPKEQGTFTMIMYTIFLIALIDISSQLPNGISQLLIMINVFTFAFSKVYYKNTQIGRMWCNIAAYVPLLLLVYVKSKRDGIN